MLKIPISRPPDKYAISRIYWHTTPQIFYRPILSSSREFYTRLSFSRTTENSFYIDGTKLVHFLPNMLSSRCVMNGKLSAIRLLRPSRSSISGICVNATLSTSTLSIKQELEGFTVKDRRKPRKRVAKEKRNAYLAWRKAAFQAEHEKATSLGLDWGIRSALWVNLGIFVA